MVRKTSLVSETDLQSEIDSAEIAATDLTLSRLDRDVTAVAYLSQPVNETGADDEADGLIQEVVSGRTSATFSVRDDLANVRDQVTQMYFASSAASPRNGLPIRYFNNGGNNFPPTVHVDNPTIDLNQFIPIHTAFNVTDIDPNSTVTRYRFRDINTSSQSGFFSLRGVAQPQGEVLEITADLLFEVRYHAAAVISSESVLIEAFDGIHWSLPAEGTFFSVEANLSPPVVTVPDFDVLSTETIDMQDIVTAEDPDGYPIIEYMFVDRLGNVNGGHFLFKGQRMPSQTFFKVKAEELKFLKYQGGQFGQAERIGIFARDSGAWSLLEEATANTTPNVFRPVVTAVDTSVLLGLQLNASQLFDATDQDGNSIKRVSFLDTGAQANSGFFTVSGVVQSPNTWFSVDINNLDTVRYNSGSVFGSEQFRVQVWDGRFKSNVSSAVIDTVDQPEVDVTTIFMFDEVELRNVKNMISTSAGPSIKRYEIIDLNDGETTAKIRLHGQLYEPLVVHTFTSAEFEDLLIQGGKSDFGRSFDEFMIRTDNGFDKSAWEGINVSTDPVNQAAVLRFGNPWAHSTPDLHMTFNFPHQINPYYCAFAFPECGAFVPMTDPGQRNAVREAFDMLATFIDVTFEEVSGNERADIEFGLTPIDGFANILAYAYIPGDVDVKDFRGDVFGDSTDDLVFQNNPGEVGYATWIHEIGHSMGLKHSFQGDDVLPLPMEDNRFSIMSYDRIFGDLEPRTFQLYDIMGLQTLYGANNNYNTGNDHIRVPPPNTGIQRTIWDAGGIDTLNMTNHNTDNILDIRQGQHSSIGPPGRFDNLTIAWGVDIENVRGGTGDDTLIGNELNNLMFGNGGRDILIGNGGNDTMRGLQGSDTYVYTIGDGWDLINEHRMAGRDVLEIHGFGTFDSLENDFTFRKLGRDLRVDLTLDRGRAYGGLTLRDQSWGGSRIETLKLFDVEGEQIGPDINLLSVFTNALNTPQQFVVTNNTSIYGNLAVPV